MTTPKTSIASERQPAISVTQHGKEFYLSRMTAKTLSLISYASVRRVNIEEGAVQRVLNTARIAGVRDFTLKGGDYPNCVILNWVDSEHPISIHDSHISFPISPRSAQLIDGQHRVAGLGAAIEADPKFSELQIPVAIYRGLTTKQCADIFLSINTEQKPVPPSLVFDLFGVSSGFLVDPAALRARDIATHLNEEKESAYYSLIKFPGSGKSRGGVPLSTVVSAVKPLVEAKGPLEQRGENELERQAKIISNFFVAMKELYGKSWDDRKNVFLYALGFTGAIDFFRVRLLDYCDSKKSFKPDIIKGALMELGKTPILQEEIKGLGGRGGANKVTDLLIQRFTPDTLRDEKPEI